MNTNSLKKVIELDELIECPDCNGTGVFRNLDTGETWKCQECDGEGYVNKNIYED